MKIKHCSFAGLGALALIATISFSSPTPIVANLFSGGTAIAQNAKKGQVHLTLSAAKKFVKQDAEGKQKITWASIKNGDTVHPGDVLRYSINGANNGEKAVKNLNLNQAIPRGMVYVVNSATVNKNENAQITNSIEGCKTYVENPTEKVKVPSVELATRPAPDTAYTHIRWNFKNSVPAKSGVDGTYQVRVR